jgi:hypothetical protein
MPYRFGEGTGLVLGATTGEGEAAAARAGIRAAEQTASKVAAVIGKFTNSPNYLQVAEKMGAKAFDIKNPAVWKSMSEGERWAANQKFLDRAIARGGDFVLDRPIKDISRISGTFRKELDYLSQRGFELSKDGSRMIRSPQFEAIQKAWQEASRHIPRPELH